MKMRVLRGIAALAVWMLLAATIGAEASAWRVGSLGRPRDRDRGFWLIHHILLNF